MNCIICMICIVFQSIKNKKIKLRTNKQPRFAEFKFEEKSTSDYFLEMETNFVMATTPQKSSDIILKHIKTSNLHFIVNETSYSLYVTIRKKFLITPFAFTTPNQQQVLLDRNPQEENSSLRENIHRLVKELLEAREILDTTSYKLPKANLQISELMSRNTCLEKESRTKSEKIQILAVDNKRLDDQLSKCKNEVSTVKKVLKIKEKEFHNSQTKIDNLEDTLAKNKVEKTELVREVSNLKKSVKSFDKKTRKINNNNKVSELTKNQKKVPEEAPKNTIKIRKESKNVEEALETARNYSSAANHEAAEEKNLYKIPTIKNPFEILSDSDDISTNSMTRVKRNITSISSNPTISINQDLKHNLSSRSASDTTVPNLDDQEDSEDRGEENFDLENVEEDFSHLSFEEQAVLNQISRMIRGSISKVS